MNCREFWRTMPGSGMAHPHLDECAACASRMRQQIRLTAGMRALAAGMARTQTPSRVEARLLTAFRNHAGTPREIGSWRHWIPAGMWAAAIAAMIAIGVFVVRDRTSEPRIPTPRHVELAVMENGSGGPDGANEDGFLPLPGASQISSAEEMSVLHVELPRSAMMQVGLEVSPERAEETVRADVMVGSDGLARAVRFVDVTGSD